MSTGKDYGLPKEYHEWVEYEEGGVPAEDHIRVHVIMHKLETETDSSPSYYKREQVSARAFTPPKPAITVPAGVGVVIGYTTPAGYQRRAIRNPRGWDVYGPEGNILCNVSEAGMHRELQHATDYTVLVGGFDKDAGEVLRNHVNAVSADLMTAIRKQGGIAL